jgi:hypothetical protein
MPAASNILFDAREASFFNKKIVVMYRFYTRLDYQLCTCIAREQSCIHFTPFGWLSICVQYRVCFCVANIWIFTIKPIIRLYPRKQIIRASEWQPVIAYRNNSILIIYNTSPHLFTRVFWSHCRNIWNWHESFYEVICVWTISPAWSNPSGRLFDSMLLSTRKIDGEPCSSTIRSEFAPYGLVRGRYTSKYNLCQL